MNIVVGIDPTHSAENVTHLLRRLRFAESEAVYASFAPYPIVPPPGLATAPDELIQRILDEQRDTACHAMKKAAEALGDVTPGDETIFDIGEPATKLEQLADERKADLIAIGSRSHNPLEAAILGSIGRGLTLHAHRSLLIVKGEVAKEGPVKAVFAYDASPCCERSIDRLIEMRPRGLTHIDLVVADTPDPGNSPVVSLTGEGGFYLGEEHRRGVLMGYARPAADRLAAAGYEVRAICAHGSVTQVIRGAVVDLHADLVIMGAQGHSWLERVLLGSKALEQAVGEPHSLLILRPRA